MDGIIDQVRRMPLAEKRELAEALREAIAEELASGAGEPDRCPRCGCPAFVRKGCDAAGRQRWLCRGCGRTFGAGTLGLLARSKLPAAAWMGLAACMADALPLRETAARVGVSLYTAWFMRMRACEVMGRRLLPARRESFEMDGTYFPESMPGNHSRGWFDLGRPAHRTGHDAARAGLGGSVCVLCGVSETGDCFCELADGAEDGCGARRAEEAAGGLLGGHRRAALLHGLPRRPAPRGAPQPRAGDGELPALQAQGVRRALQRGVEQAPPALPRLVLLTRAVPAQRPRPARAPVRPRGVGDLRVHARADAPGVAPLPEPGQPRQHRGEVRLYVNGGLTAGMLRRWAILPSKLLAALFPFTGSIL